MVSGSAIAIPTAAEERGSNDVVTIEDYVLLTG